MQRAVHDDDCRDDILFFIATRFAEPRRVSDGDIGDVFHKYRHTVRLRKQDVLDVFDPIALRQISGAAAVHETDAANVHRLLSYVDGPATHVDVGAADRADHLRQRDVVCIELMQIDFRIVLLAGPAPGVDLHDTGYRQ